MFRVLLLSAAAAALLNAPAQACEADAAGATTASAGEHLRVLYNGYFFGLRVMKASLDVDLDGCGYEAASVFRTAGLAGFFKDSEIHADSAGGRAETGLAPLWYEHENVASKKNRKIRMDFTADDVISTVTPPFGSMGLPSGGPLDMRKLAKAAPGGNADQAIAQMTNRILNMAEKTGNVRLDAVTVGLKFFQGDTGFVVAIGHGQYDAALVATQFKNMGAEPIDVNGMAVFKPDDEVAFITQSDKRAAITAGENAALLPVEAITAAFKKDDGKLQLKGSAKELLAKVDRKKRIWMVGEVPEPLRHQPFTRAFNSFTMEGDLKDSKLALKVVGIGEDPAAVAEAAATFKTELANMIAKAENQKAQMLAQQQQMAGDPRMAQHAGRLDAIVKSIDASVKTMKTIKLDKGDTTVTITGEADLGPEGGAAALMGMGVMF